MAGNTTASTATVRTTDDLEYLFWELCRDWWGFDAFADQWWGFGAKCEHGEFFGESAGLLPGLREAMEQCYGEALQGHTVGGNAEPGNPDMADQTPTGEEP